MSKRRIAVTALSIPLAASFVVAPSTQAQELPFKVPTVEDINKTIDDIREASGQGATALDLIGAYAADPSPEKASKAAAAAMAGIPDERHRAIAERMFADSLGALNDAQRLMAQVNSAFQVVASQYGDRSPQVMDARLEVTETKAQLAERAADGDEEAYEVFSKEGSKEIGEASVNATTAKAEKEAKREAAKAEKQAKAEQKQEERQQRQQQKDEARQQRQAERAQRTEGKNRSDSDEPMSVSGNSSEVDERSASKERRLQEREQRAEERRQRVEQRSEDRKNQQQEQRNEARRAADDLKDSKDNKDGNARSAQGERNPEDATPNVKYQNGKPGEGKNDSNSSSKKDDEKKSVSPEQKKAAEEYSESAAKFLKANKDLSDELDNYVAERKKYDENGNPFKSSKGHGESAQRMQQKKKEQDEAYDAMKKKEEAAKQAGFSDDELSSWRKDTASRMSVGRDLNVGEGKNWKDATEDIESNDQYQKRRQRADNGRTDEETERLRKDEDEMREIKERGGSN